MLRKITILLGLFILSPALWAMSQVPVERHTIIQFTNSTPHTLSAYIAAGSNVELLATQVMPLSTVALADITRTDVDDDITIALSNAEYSFNLTQRVINSELAFGIESETVTIEPQTDSAIQRVELQLADHTNTLAFNSEKLSKGGKVNYVLQLQDQKPAIGPGNEFSLLSYNIWATTIFGSKKVDTRLTEMPAV
ncbi:hypothetical protein [Moritella sp. Urea-trap-13]|uniref:hypothetical protein n=1 Tax=Moritella sp. Urea-trap-13 TaxID=2058327 RepID=UPI001E36AD54|nr:hypothetical protein [Moritella sp. Urea-trap-13]